MKVKILPHFALLCFCFLLFLCSNPLAKAADVTNLRCEYRINPLGIDVAKPRLSWLIESNQRGEYQSAYQILVASTPTLLENNQGDLWDSGQVLSNQSVHIEYGGEDLHSHASCHWKVRIWDKDGQVSDWSPSALWTMGFLSPKDWQAAWIKPVFADSSESNLENSSWIWLPQTNTLDQSPPGTIYFRGRLTVPQQAKIQKASVSMTADNAFVLYINGQESLQGEDWHTPQTLEITQMLKDGENLFAVAAHNGGTSPNPAGLIGQILIELTDGSRQTLETGPGWKAHTQEQPHWQDPGFNDTDWPEAQVIKKYGEGVWGDLKNERNLPSPWIRKVFTLPGSPQWANAYVNVMGYYELYINGEKVGTDVLSPAVTNQTKRSFYKTYDVRKFLRPGNNCIGLWLGSGWYRSTPIARVQIDGSIDGKPLYIGTDRSWICAPSTHTQIGGWQWGDMGGERIDSRREITGWSEPECSDGEWLCVEEIAPPPGAVEAQPCPPNRISETISLATCTPLAPHTWELDFGTNLTGWLRLRFPHLETGQRVKMYYADKRYQTPSGDTTPAGKIKPTSQIDFQTNSGPISYQNLNQIDEFISSGKPGEEFCSKFNYHGFRYVIVEGLPIQPALDDAEALLVESNLEPAGMFTCSNPLLNRIHQTNLWTLRCLDLGGYMVDCPHRERMGYGDGQVGFESLAMNLNAATFYGKWAIDWLEAQNPETGEIPYTAPKYFNSGGGPAWGGAGCVLPWKVYLYYGDRRLLANAYESMRHYLSFLESKCTDNILRRYGGDWDFIGDWVPPKRGMDTNNWPSKQSAEIFNNAYRVYLWEILEQSARQLGKTREADDWAQKIDQIRPLIHAAFYDAEKQQYGLDEQSYQVMPLMTGIVPEDLDEIVLKKLEDLILEKNQGHLDTGMLGTYFLIHYLQDIGRSDLLYTIFTQTTYPGWGYMLSQGATTFWEQWNGYYSQIHSCFTSPGSWFYQGLAGIQPDETAPGFERFKIKPAIVGELEWVQAHYDSIHGRIVSQWKREGRKLKMDITIPANTSATVFVPAKQAALVFESGQPADQANHVKFIEMRNNTAVYTVGSGTYSFQSTLPDSGE